MFSFSNRSKDRRGFKTDEEGKFGRGFQQVHKKYAQKKRIKLNVLLNMLNSYLGKVKKLFLPYVKTNEGGHYGLIPK